MGQTSQSIIINAPVDKVWNTIRNFHNMDWSPNIITSLEVVGTTPGDTAGARRILNNAFHETLKTIDDNQKEFSYSIDDGPSPISKDDVKNYVGRVKVGPAGQEGQTAVEWTSSWEQNDEAAHDFCHNIYVALLDDMKKSLE